MAPRNSLPADRLELERRAELESANVWRLDRSKILSGLALGQRAADLTRWLAERSGRPLPETVKTLVHDCEKRVGAVTVSGTATLVTCRDEALAAEIACAPRAQKHCRHAGSNLLLVPTGREDRFRKTLLDLGYPLPAKE